MRNHYCQARIFPWPLFVMLFCLLPFCPGTIHAERIRPVIVNDLLLCDNVTEGGSISGDETGCPDPVFDPSVIVNVILPSGGSGDLEYVWMFTTVDPALPITSWLPLPNSNSPDFDPGPITQTTWYRRCSRRSGCTEYVGETGYVTKEVKCCENVTDPGLIGSDQSVCAVEFDPSPLVEISPATGGSGGLIYNWYSSAVGLPFDPGTWDLIPGADQSGYDPGILTTTTWFVRTVRRENCTDFLASGPVLIALLPSPDVLAVIQQVDCFGQSTGSIDVTVSGGTPPYSFDWTNAPDTEDQTALAAGIYTLIVVDAKGCSHESEFHISQSDELLLEGIQTDILCHGNKTGSIVLSVSGGTPPVTFLWNTGATTASLSGLGAGAYSVTATDQLGCVKSAQFNLTEPNLLTGSTIPKHVTCAGAADGEINLQIAGGTGPFSYLWAHGPDTQDVGGLAGDVYQVTITDSHGCSQVLQQEIHEPAPLDLVITVTDPTCEGGTDGEATVNASGGVMPYSYQWNDLGASQEMTAQFLGAGSFTVTVTDANGCSSIAQVTLQDGTGDCEITIGDFVWLDSDRDGIQDANEYGQNGILVKLVKFGPDGDYGTPDDEVIDSTYTSGFGFNTGYYLFTDVQPGTFSICFVIDTSAFQFTLMDAGGNDAEDSDPEPSTGCVAEFTILPGAMDDLTFDAGIHDRCVNVLTGGEIGYDEVLCAPWEDPDEIINLVFPTGGLGNLEYLWLRSEIDLPYFPGNPNWEPIPNSNAPAYNPGPIGVTTYYIRCARREGCWDYPAESTIVTKSVIDPVADISGPTGPLCVDEEYFYMADNNGPNAIYTWDFGPNGHPQTANGLVVNHVSWDAPGLHTITLNVMVDGCEVMTSIQVQVDACGGKHVIDQFDGLITALMDVDLRWHSPNYVHNHVYVVERSVDGIEFVYQATIPGKPGEDSWYTYQDQTPEWGENIYRVKMVSGQGIMAISPPIRIVVKEQDMFNVILYPNPIANQITVRILESLTTETRLDFYDALGRRLHQEFVQANMKSVQIDCHDWPSGPVLVWVIQEKKRPYSLVLQKTR